MATDNSFLKLKHEVSFTLVDTTRTAGQISNEDLAFHRSSNSSIIPLLESQSSRLLRLGQRLIRSFSLGTEIPTPHLSNIDSIEDNWGSIVDIFDDLLERADACLDEYTGAIRRLSPSQEGQLRRVVPPAGRQKPDRAYRSQNIAKPQLLFRKVPTNDELTPFKPLIHSKPHAITPFEESLVLVPSLDGSQQYALHSISFRKITKMNRADAVDSISRYKHPYETEIRTCQYPAQTYVKADPTPYMPFETTRATLVDTPEALASMVKELRSAKEVAVDLEHHDKHSYIGLVSLMQISTRKKDWIVDTLKPWRQDLEILNEIFTDPNILKVFHGAYMDMIWLQRDFGLYVVGLFDTFHASRALGYPRNSLAYLLKRFANFDAAKQYQMADWRIRPIPEEMFNYARSDTHFLLHIYDNLRNEIVDTSDNSREDGDLLNEVMINSKEESLQHYERPFYDAQRGMGAVGWYALLCRTPALFNREQFTVFRAVHQWRDIVAREEDESVHTIMSKKVLYNIAREVPTDMPTLLGCSHPMSRFFHKEKEHLLRLISQAKVEAATGPEMKDLMGSIQSPYIDCHESAAKDNRTCRLPANAVQESELSSFPKVIARATKGEASVFWGPIISNKLSSSDHNIQLCSENLRLSLPLPQLAAEIIEDQRAASDAAEANFQPVSTLYSEHQHVRNRSSEQEIFIVQEAGTSQKRKATEMQEDSESPLSKQRRSGVERIENGASGKRMSVNIDGEEPQAELIERKRSRKAKEGARELGNSPSGPNDVKPFDYANAPPVLHAKRIQAPGIGGMAENPYVKSSDAPKGLRKTRNEGGVNKSLTFKP